MMSISIYVIIVYEVVVFLPVVNPPLLFLIMVDLVTSLQYGIPSAIIVLLYLIITKVADIITERNKEKKRIEVNSEIIDCFNI